MNKLKKLNKKGFTMAELLIVVAIIAVMVMIAIPVFSGQLQRAELNTDLANARGAYANAVATAMANPSMSGSKMKVTVSIPHLHTQSAVSKDSAQGKVTLTHSKNSNLKGSFSYDKDNVSLTIS